MDSCSRAAFCSAPEVLLGALLAACLALACGHPVGVSLADPHDVARDLAANAVANGVPSTETAWELSRLGIADLYESDPPAALEALRARLDGHGDRGRLFALAELSYLWAERGGGRAHYRAAALYAYAFLVRAPGEERVRITDPRARRAGDLYERGLSRGFEGVERGSVVFSDEVAELPFGELAVTLDRASFSWGSFELRDFVSAADLEVTGLRNRYRSRGLGAPLVAAVAPIAGRASPAEARRVPPGVKVPVTAILRVEDPRSAVRSGQVRGRITLYPADEIESFSANAMEIPLEIEWSAALADTLATAKFPPSDLLAAPNASGEHDQPDGLYMFEPHRPGRIPVVLIHGTAANPRAWGNLVNELESDSQIRQRFEFWYFSYRTTSPIAYSGALLRDALSGAVHELDPEGRDPALRRMVLVGHSQGGLLAHLAVIHSGNAFWDQLTSESFEEVELDPEAKWVLERSLFVEPLPFVRRVIFLSTPHHGSYLASFRIEALTPWIIHLPESVADLGGSLLELDLPQGKAKRALGRIPTSMDNMTPGNAFLETLAGIPLAPGITAHSIMGVKGDGIEPDANDGLVAYSSAHFPAAVSERVIPHCSHATETNPLSILEVRRILREHLETQ